jgi:hypothetical protein
MHALALALALAAAPSAQVSSGPPFVPDDYPRALADARARSVPLVIDVWAPW